VLTRAARAVGTMVGTILMATGCYHSVAKPGVAVPAEGSRIGVRFAAATDVRAITAAGDTVTLPRMQSVRGRLAERRGDTLIVALDRWPEESNGGGPAPRAIVIRTPDVLLEQRELSVTQTAGTVGFVVVLVSLAALVALVIALESAFGDS
jgi:hypothetical protein